MTTAEMKANAQEFYDQWLSQPAEARVPILPLMLALMKHLGIEVQE